VTHDADFDSSEKDIKDLKDKFLRGKCPNLVNLFVLIYWCPVMCILEYCCWDYARKKYKDRF